MMKKLFSRQESLKEALRKGIDAADVLHESMDMPVPEEELRAQGLGSSFFWLWATRDVA